MPPPARAVQAEPRMADAAVRVGCSGWEYDHWRDRFYPRRLPRGRWRLTTFLAALADADQAIEFRDEAWYRDDVLGSLERCGVALCLHDMRGSGMATKPIGPFVYVRFHGTGQRYAGSYSSQRLTVWAERLTAWAHVDRRALVYFNNDVGGHALRDADRLRDMLLRGGRRLSTASRRACRLLHGAP